MENKDDADLDQVSNSVPEAEDTSKEVESEVSGGAEEDSVQKEEISGKVSKPVTVKIGDEEYPIDQVQAAIQKARDYDYLLPEFTKVTQRLSVLEAARKGTEKPPTTEETELRKAAELLAPYIQPMIQSQYVSREELNQMKEDQRLASTLQVLEEKYDGADGMPKFDRFKVLEFCVVNGITNPENGYKLLNEKEIREFYARQGKTAPPAPLSNVGEGVSREPVGKKRVFGLPEKPEEEVSLRDAMEDRLKNLGSE